MPASPLSGYLMVLQQLGTKWQFDSTSSEDWQTVLPHLANCSEPLT
jgi:hypothetical protein